MEFPKDLETILQTGEGLEALYGNWSKVPPNWKDATPDEFWGHVSSYGFGARREYRQVSLFKYKAFTGDVMRPANIHLLFYKDGTGLAVEVQWKHPAKPTWVPIFYKFALCEHECVYTRVTNRGWHEGHCSKCGMEMNYDSGD